MSFNTDCSVVAQEDLPKSWIQKFQRRLGLPGDEFDPWANMDCPADLAWRILLSGEETSGYLYSPHWRVLTVVTVDLGESGAEELVDVAGAIEPKKILNVIKEYVWEFGKKSGVV